jgi:cleavage and polyadenylation specificity factor subunit 1
MDGVNGNGASASYPASQPQILLLASHTGTLATLAPLAEQEYRRLSSLASQLATSLPHAGGLNPRAHRAPPPSASGVVGRHPPAVDAGVGRSIVDGAILARWNELGAGRRAEAAGRVGFAGVAEVRATLEGILGWNGLAYL